MSLKLVHPPPRFALIALFCITTLFFSSTTFASDYKRTIVNIDTPDVVLVNQKGERVRLNSYLNSDMPVVVDFIFATCTTICPVLSASIVNVQNKFAAEKKEILLVSITIDPENDTPKILSKYLQRYQAKPGWDFLTGSRSDIDSVMGAFDAYFYDKMDHLPLYFVSTGKKGEWLRLEGFISGNNLRKEISQQKQINRQDLFKEKTYASNVH